MKLIKMIRLISILFIIFSFSVNAQDKIILLDSTFNYFFVDESTPLPFSPDLSFKFGIPDSSKILIEVHKIVPNSNSSEINSTIPILTIVDKILPRGKYQVCWYGEDNNGNKMNYREKYVYYFSATRKVHTLNGVGYIKIESKCKIASLIN